MPRKVPSETLPATLQLHVRPVHLEDAICASPTQCAIAKCIDALEINGIQPSYSKVNPNKITITYNGYIHHYNVPDKAMKLIREFDGKQELANDGKLTLKLLSTPRKTEIRTEERRKQINIARQKRAAEGRPDKAYPDYRRSAALSQGKAYVANQRKAAKRQAAAGA